METNHKSVTILLKITIELNNDQFHIHTQLQDQEMPSVPLVPVLLPNPEAEEDFLFDGPNAITIGEAMDKLHCVRGTVDNLRKEGKLTSYYHGRHVRLDLREVMEATKWWSVMKGKI